MDEKTLGFGYNFCMRRKGFLGLWEGAERDALCKRERTARKKAPLVRAAAAIGALAFIGSLWLFSLPAKSLAKDEDSKELLSVGGLRYGFEDSILLPLRSGHKKSLRL